MKIKKYVAIFLLSIISLLFFSNSMGSVNSKDEACNILIKKASIYHFVAKGQASGVYTCEYYAHNGNYYVFGLHFRLTIPTNKPQSNLVGWFAVSDKDGGLYEWDMANLTLGPSVKNIH